MRFMVLVKASKESEAGVLPDEETLLAMAKYNEELVKAGVMLSGRRLASELQGYARAVRRQEAHGHRRAVCRNQGAPRGLLDLAMQVQGGSCRLAQARRRSTAAPKSRFARSSSVEDFGDSDAVDKHRELQKQTGRAKKR